MAIDWLTEQLRKAFIPINKKADKAQKVAERELRKKERRKNSKARFARAEKARLDAESFEKSKVERPCRECGRPAKADPEFFLNPVLCQRCKGRANDIDLGIHPRKGDDFTEVTIFKGGAPGLGRRK